jgi:hypothetical protein
MTNQHPITPPPELVQQWMTEYTETKPNCLGTEFIAARAAQWGADQELEACCEWLKLEGHEHEHEALLAARRPKPPSLKEEALKGFGTIAGIVLDEYSGTTFYEEYKKVTDTICRALEALPND